MTFSFIIPYRNREMARVRNCLQSIQNQYFKDFEIVFVDYGSDLPIKMQVEELCGNYSQVNYFYFDVRYQLWSRAHAVNLGISNSKGKFLIIVDIDLIYSPHFATVVHSQIDEDHFVQYQCYYLPENEHDYQNLDFNKPYPYRVSSVDMAAGLIAVPRKKMYVIGGFDEYFKVWGVEDLDLKKRLQAIGLSSKILSINQLANFHQWHPSAAQEDLMPTLWLSAMEKYAKNKSLAPLPYLEKNNDFRRPTLDFINGKSIVGNFTFEYPTLQSFVKFAQLFYSLNSGEYLIVNQLFETIQVSKKSRLGGLFSKANNLLEKVGISYRITELFTFETEIISYINIRDFLFYFIAENKNYIADYLLDNTHLQQIKCILLKA
ncbi:MAG: glycosyltransferase [Cytophagales bacterium]|nr:MAG: glycosyltransferase [Cytophagales bacterium]